MYKYIYICISSVYHIYTHSSTSNIYPMSWTKPWQPQTGEHLWVQKAIAVHSFVHSINQMHTWYAAGLRMEAWIRFNGSMGAGLDSAQDSLLPLGLISGVGSRPRLVCQASWHFRTSTRASPRRHDVSRPFRPNALKLSTSSLALPQGAHGIRFLGSKTINYRLLGR